MDWRAVRILLSLLIVVAAFVAWELAGLDPHLPAIHTISFIAEYDSPALRFAIGAAFLLGGAGGFLWWAWHMRRRIFK
jgi:hypothetical protein